ncbi:4Fe-4S dicluster domain-containing protein [Patescibacteria group bacterium]|nr:4Fe-4S dicluster domain-containing protein [Patescibacteria group bacterium]MBU1673081.1 4Fe-4S dicluster domain-containing protein [Patescibacteria group bacterium]MBU1963687.1 4Fe-4S dicluster domain-containing protein [Patescibacteria group bacterium]
MTNREMEKLIKHFEDKGYMVHNFLHQAGKIPWHPFKDYFFPPKQQIFKYEKGKYIETLDNSKQVLLGVNVVDLKAFQLWDQVYARDPYYQARLKNTIIVGLSSAPKDKIAYKSFILSFGKDVLEHLRFDLFLCAPTKNNYHCYTGSEDGQKILDDLGYKDYEHINFIGPFHEGQLDKAAIDIREKLKNREVKKIWDDLGKRCIECGRCTYVCPCCYCFEITDDEKGNRYREWSNCFQHEFSEVAGDHKFIHSTAQRIFFYYYHKFVRDMDKYNMPGCVGCNRCSNACPVGIDINKVIKQIKES